MDCGRSTDACTAVFETRRRALGAIDRRGPRWQRQMRLWGRAGRSLTARVGGRSSLVSPGALSSGFADACCGCDVGLHCAARVERWRLLVCRLCMWCCSLVLPVATMGFICFFFLLKLCVLETGHRCAAV